MNRVKAFPPLIRPRLSAMVAVSALAGYILHPRPADLAIAAALAGGTFLLAAGCSALNQVQERAIDARMERTRERPIPAGRISPAGGLALAWGFIAAGLCLLVLTRQAVAAAMGGFAVLWYNGVYTPLKRKTAFAILPGALCGSLPPLMGWAAAGGDPTDYRILLPAGVFYLWQIPHFCLLACRHREDFQRAGLPTLFQTFGEARSFRITLVWTLALTAAALMLFALGILRGFPPQAGLIPAALWLLGALATTAWRGLSRIRSLSGPLYLFLAALTVALLVQDTLY